MCHKHYAIDADLFGQLKGNKMVRKILFGALGMSALMMAACSQPETAKEDARLVEGQGSPTPVLLNRGVIPTQSEDSYYKTAAARVDARAAGRSFGNAKNVILFVGDGMGISTITAARIHAGQKKGVDGESYQLAMETLPHAALSKTYSHDAQVSDSASTATAMVAGVKVRSRTLGVTQEANYSNCASTVGNGTDTIFELAEGAGLATGIISTARLTHATPAATFAETPNRDWEDDGELPGAGENACKDIARQFIDWPAGNHFEIALGGGARHFLPEDSDGRRKDARNLAEAWMAKSDAHTIVTNKTDFEATDFTSDARVLGLFESSHMQYEVDRDTSGEGEPSLEEMTRAAITRLSQDDDGYVLLVEAGRIDHGHHGTNAARALGDTLAFDEAIAAALDITDVEDTLIIVTADHSHTFVIQGYPIRGNPILGKVSLPDGRPAPAGDGKPFTTLSYANGSSAYETFEDGERVDLTETDTTAKDFKQQSLLPSPSETHAGEDVAIFARGPGAELVAGVMEQNEIFHVMGKASGLVED